MACTLTASGADFAAIEFLGKSELSPSLIWHRGDLIVDGGAISGAPRAHSTSGFAVRISDAGRDDFPTQLADAEAFLVGRASELRRLRSEPGLDDLWLEFGVLLRPDVLHVDCLTARFVQVAGLVPISVAVTHYLV